MPDSKDPLDQLLEQAAREQREDLEAIASTPRTREDALIVSRFKERLGLEAPERISHGEVSKASSAESYLTTTEKRRPSFRLVPLLAGLAAAAAAAVLILRTPEPQPLPIDVPGVPSVPGGPLPLGPTLSTVSGDEATILSWSDDVLELDLMPELEGAELESGSLTATLLTDDGQLVAQSQERYSPIWRVSLDSRTIKTLQLNVELLVDGVHAETRTSTLTR